MDAVGHCRLIASCRHLPTLVLTNPHNWHVMALHPSVGFVDVARPMLDDVLSFYFQARNLPQKIPSLLIEYDLALESTPLWAMLFACVGSKWLARAHISIRRSSAGDMQ